MENNIIGNQMNERTSFEFSRRTSTGGYPNAQYAHYFPSLYDSKYVGELPMNINGATVSKQETSNQTFFSENNINLYNRQNPNFQTDSALDPRYILNDSTQIQKFTSTPLIPQNLSQNQLNQIKFVQMPGTFNPTFTTASETNTIYNPQMNSNSLIYPNNGSFPYIPAFVLCDDNPDSHRDIIYYAKLMPSSNQEFETDQFYCSDARNYINFNPHVTNQHLSPPVISQKVVEESCFKCQLSMTQDNFENNTLPDFRINDPMYFMPLEMPLNSDEKNLPESHSMPSLHDNDSAVSDLETSENDKRNTVHGDEMLQELKKMSSVFNNVESMPCCSRFKKTRIEERITLWHLRRFVVIDDMVKVIPDNVLRIQRLDLETLDKLEIDIFGQQLSETIDALPVELESPECLHSVCRCRSAPLDSRYSKHYHHANIKYRTRFNSLSPNDQSNLLNQSSRHSSVKTPQIPIKMPLMFNRLSSMYSPVVHSNNRKFFEPTNVCNNKNSRRTRRWSVSGSKLEKSFSTCGLRAHAVKHANESSYQPRFDFANDYYDNRLSLELEDVNESCTDLSSDVFASVESKLDKHLVAIKKTVMSFVESNFSEIRYEIQSLHRRKASLENQLMKYKEKVELLENTIRHNLPEEKWQLYGVVNNTSYQL